MDYYPPSDDEKLMPIQHDPLEGQPKLKHKTPPSAKDIITHTPRAMRSRRLKWMMPVNIVLGIVFLLSLIALLLSARALLN